jgi:putative hemolysin
MKLLEQFKRTHLPVALVVDEFGDTQGLVSLTDVTSSIVGALPTEPGEEPLIGRRDDVASWAATVATIVFGGTDRTRPF